MVTIIAATDPSGVIAVNGKIPWHYKADMRRFKQVTMGAHLIVGRKTWETLPPLPGRTVSVLTRSIGKLHATGRPLFAASSNFRELLTSLLQSGLEVVVAGGGEVYALALESGLVDAIDLTIVPKVQYSEGDVITRFPAHWPLGFKLTSLVSNEMEPCLQHRRYDRYEVVTMSFVGSA